MGRCLRKTVLSSSMHVRMATGARQLPSVHASPPCGSPLSFISRL